MMVKYMSILVISQSFNLSKKEFEITKIWTVLLLIRIIRNFDDKIAGVIKTLVRHYHVFLTE